ncbi:MAG: adenylate/guanylate cyclase domain-containing protein [Methylococcaceae bacterium]|nr:MAG: adenylate/guanylate cyclase domain-containing protein [Methylococcaceae bacterium]
MMRNLLPLTIIVLALFVQLQDPPFRARIREIAFDQLQALHPAGYQDAVPVRVIAIDDASLNSLGQWPWPRTLLARIVDRLFEWGAQVVVFDIVLAEADRSSPEQLALHWPEHPALGEMLRKLPAHDQLLADSFKRGPVVTGFPAEPVATAMALPHAKARFLSFGGDARAWLPRYAGGIANLPLLDNAAQGGGVVSLAPDHDGVLRALPLLHDIGDELYPSLGLEALRVSLGLSQLTLKVSPPDAARHGLASGIQGIDLGRRGFLPTAPDGRVWLHFRPLATERYISAQDLLAGTVERRLIKDHVVFIGATAKGLGDTTFSPLGEVIPGVEGHVQLLEQLLSGTYLQRPGWENDFVTALLIGAWGLLSLLLARFRPVWSVVLAAATITGLFAFALWLFEAWRLMLDPLYPVRVLVLLFVAMLVPRYLRTEREQRWIRDAFSRYVSPNRVKYLQAHPEHLELGGVYRECSFVMTDLADFTPLMEQHQPDVLSGLLNEYLNGMIGIAFRYDGTLDRITGDAVAVMFSAPLPQPDHAARAVACALAMGRFADAFSRRQRELGIPFGRTRIGVNTGTVLVGNFGGQAMLDYRALGDAVNLAARLERINAQFGTATCVSGATVAQCPDFKGRPMGRLIVKGKTQAVTAFEPLSEAQAQAESTQAYLEAYALMEAEAPAATAAFARLAEKHPDDPLAVYHARRLAGGETGSLVVLLRK